MSYFSINNIKLDSPKEEDLKGLHNIIIDPTNLDEKSSFFVVENHGLNKSIISDYVTYLLHFTNNYRKINILKNI
ncbi:hypothetical protein FE243_06900 [Aliarcobacter thereius]|uniref:hypothetical protein n=1 Tax=Aliarcobacter thereius TaxID=544718 RepID=UPI0010FE780D|nr:hypothetical protein [Aliarcobacter thereius]TLT06622.1 hypothetical protein FE243_06900 [Aliarcobacter thereius]